MQKYEINILIDKLTNSIENVITGDSFPTEITPITSQDLKKVNKRNKWLFNWKREFSDTNRNVFKLTIVNNQTIIQGLISLEIKTDHIFIHLVENAPFNVGQNKVYSGVAGNLIAFACKLSIEKGYEGNVAFLSKSELVEHYKKMLGAIHIGGRIMIINSSSALKLINKYFK